MKNFDDSGTCGGSVFKLKRSLRDEHFGYWATRATSCRVTKCTATQRKYGA
ncbi:hypothetical protein [Nostoc sp.]|uniref:hypothetical protein n=1 Tax=Nostoc sp. TaxID=1180 RepID=UPI002FF4A5C9